MDHLDDLDADFLRYYRRDWTELDGPRFFSLADRVFVYGGVMAHRAAEAARDVPEPVARLAELAEDETLEVG